MALSAVFGCQSPRLALTNQQQLAASLNTITDLYLTANIERPSFGGKVFCAHKVLGIEQDDHHLNEYVYAICQEYHLRNGELMKGTGTAMPVALQLERRDQAYQIVRHQVPGDSSRFAVDVKRIFPEQAHREIFHGDHSDVLAEVEKAAKAAYGIN